MDIMELNRNFIDGLWSQEINVSDFVNKNITPYSGNASFLQGPTERTKRIWDLCLKALEEERIREQERQRLAEEERIREEERRKFEEKKTKEKQDDEDLLEEN